MGKNIIVIMKMAMCATEYINLYVKFSLISFLVATFLKWDFNSSQKPQFIYTQNGDNI
jgi:PKD repeat protein